ncbi:MAG: phage Gp37/Gp68 family protein [Burkholderiales bacterium]|jgi:protein gp37|nr:phage Gp37/Gp68 family protein [Burkholderiales bacterium]
MAENSKIEWCDHTFNPWLGCTKVSPACDNCYAEQWGKRFGVEWGAGKERKRTSASNWKLPLRWNRNAELKFKAWKKFKETQFGLTEGDLLEQGFIKPQRPRVFCGSLCDVFDNAVPDEWRIDLFNLIWKTPHLNWLLLTKRIGNALAMLAEATAILEFGDPDIEPWTTDKPWPHVWLGTTVCNQEEADRDIPKLLQTPAAVRFLSIEPMLEKIDLSKWLIQFRCHLCGHESIKKVDGFVCQECNREAMGNHHFSLAIDQVIVGGESGKNARQMHPDWSRNIRDQCAAAGVPFMFKQWGEYHPSMWIEGGRLNVASFSYKTTKCAGTEMVRVGKKAAGRLLDGVLHDEYPRIA